MQKEGNGHYSANPTFAPELMYKPETLVVTIAETDPLSHVLYSYAGKRYAMRFSLS